MATILMLVQYKKYGYAVNHIRVCLTVIMIQYLICHHLCQYNNK